MKKIAISLILLTSCSGSHGSHKYFKTTSSAGHAYLDCQKASMTAQYIASRDLTDEEIDEADDIPGGGYSDGKWTGENPDKCGSRL